MFFGKVNIGIMGCGYAASKMGDTFPAVKKAKLYAVASRSLEKAERFAEKYGAEKAYGSYEELVNDPRVDMIYIATPNSEHYAHARLCIEHGKAVICEKPFMTDCIQAEEIIRLAGEKNLFVMEAMWTRFLPEMEKLRSILKEGYIGEPMMMTANLSVNAAGLERIREPRLGGGALLDMGVYPLNLASVVFGDDVADIRAGGTRLTTGPDAQEGIVLTYRNGKMAVLSVSCTAHGDKRAFIHGTKGYLEILNCKNPEQIIVYGQSGEEVARYRRGKQRTGLEFEINAAVRAYRDDRTETEEMPHGEMLSMMKMLDFIRKQLVNADNNG